MTKGMVFSVLAVLGPGCRWLLVALAAAGSMLAAGLVAGAAQAGVMEAGAAADRVLPARVLAANAAAWGDPAGVVEAGAAADNRGLQARVLAANAASWIDPAGDGEAGVAPDITSVLVSNTDAGVLTIRVAMPAEPVLLSDTLVHVLFDVDESVATIRDIRAAPERLVEYFVEVDGAENRVDLFRWDGSDWRLVPSSSVGFRWEEGPTITLDARDIGSPSGFNFWVVASWQDAYGTSFHDWAPGGLTVWNYRMGTVAGEPPPDAMVWSDPAGDTTDGLGPDITSVWVSNTGDRVLTIRVAMPDEPVLRDGVFLDVQLDVDENPETGNRLGFEYIVFVDDESTGLYRWDGQYWRLVPSSSVSSFWGYGATITLNARDIGSPSGFDFDAVSVWLDADDFYYDVAPRIGVWNYQITGTVPPPVRPLSQRPTAGGEWAYTEPAAAYTGKRVVVHYVTVGPDAPPLDDADADGFPDYVEKIAVAADRALGKFERLGFRSPLPDTGGPDARPDIYVKRLKRGTPGIAVAHTDSDRGAFLLVGTRLNRRAVLAPTSLRLTVAHELFHLVQYAYTPDGGLPRWITEGTAAAAEAIAFPQTGETNWLRRVGGWLDEPWRSLHSKRFSCERCYGGTLWWLALHQDDPGLLPAYLDRLGQLHRLGRPYGIGAAALDNTIRQREALAVRQPPPPTPGRSGRLPVKPGEFGSLHGALAEFAENIYRAGLTPGTLRKLKPRKRQRTTRSRELAAFSIHYIPVTIRPGTRQLQLTVKTTSGEPPDVRLLIGGPNGQTITSKTNGTAQIITAQLRNRRSVMLIITNGHRNPATYRITHRAK